MNRLLAPLLAALVALGSPSAAFAVVGLMGGNGPAPIVSAIPDGTRLVDYDPAVTFSNATWDASFDGGQGAWRTTCPVSDAVEFGGSGCFDPAGDGSYGAIIALGDQPKGTEYNIYVSYFEAAAPYDPVPIQGSASEFDGAQKLLRIRTRDSLGVSNGFVDCYGFGRQPTAGQSNQPSGVTFGCQKEGDPNAEPWNYATADNARGVWHDLRMRVVLDDVPRDQGGTGVHELYVDGVLAAMNTGANRTLINPDDVGRSVFWLTQVNGTPLQDLVTHFRGFRVEITPPPPPQGSFVTLAASDLAGEAWLSRRPTVYDVPPIDDSGWTNVLDPTCEAGTGCTPQAGTNAFPSSWGCDAVTPDDGLDDGFNFGCLMDAAPQQTRWEYPDGVFDMIAGFDGRWIWRPKSADSQQGLQCNSRATVFRIHSGFEQAEPLLTWFEGDDLELGPDLGWTNVTATEGATTMVVGSTATLAPGDWVELDADPDGIDGANADTYYTTVASVTNATTFEITHPLPEDFTGADPTLREWSPMEEFFMRNCTVELSDPLHAVVGIDQLITIRNMARVELTNNRLHNFFRTGILFAQGADILFAGNDVDDVFASKGANMYSTQTTQVSRMLYFDNAVTGATMAAFGNGGQQLWIVANLFFAPPPPCVDANNDARCDDGSGPAFDVSCNESLEGDGGSNDCLVDEAWHAAAHGPTFTAAAANALCTAADSPFACCDGDGVGSCTDAYGHCRVETTSAAAYRDMKGWTGDTGCHLAPTGNIYSSWEAHNQALANSIFERNVTEGPSWYDNANGAGENLWHNGNQRLDAPRLGGQTYNTSPGPEGGHHHRDVGGGVPAGFRDTSVWINESYEAGFTDTSGLAFDVYGDAIVVTDSAMTSCHSEGASDPSGSRCTVDPTSYLDPTGTIFQHSCVGDDHHNGAGCDYGSDPASYSRTMPWLIGGDEWPHPFNLGTPSAAEPFTNLGDPDSARPCLPAEERYFGSCL